MPGVVRSENGGCCDYSDCAYFGLQYGSSYFLYYGIDNSGRKQIDSPLGL